MTNPRPVAVILAAGVGTRLHPYTADRPKCLVEVAGQTLLARCLAACRSVGIEEGVLVVGYRAAQIRSASSGFRGLGIRFVDNPAYATTGTAESTRLAILAVPERDIVLIEGDVLFDEALLRRMLDHPIDDVTLVDLFEGYSGSLVTLDGDRVTAWLHERARPPDFPIAGTWKTVNITRIGARSVRRGLLPAIEHALGEHGAAAPLEFAMNGWVQKGARLVTHQTEGLPWHEVDTPEDLARASTLFSQG